MNISTWCYFPQEQDIDWLTFATLMAKSRLKADTSPVDYLEQWHTNEVDCLFVFNKILKNYYDQALDVIHK